MTDGLRKREFMKIMNPGEEREQEKGRTKRERERGSGERRRKTGRWRALSGCSVCLGDACSGWMIVWRRSPGRCRGGLMEKK